jgi:hypothetical protein
MAFSSIGGGNWSAQRKPRPAESQTNFSEFKQYKYYMNMNDDIFWSPLEITS